MLRKLIVRSTLLWLVLLPAAVLNADVIYTNTGPTAPADNLPVTDEIGSVTAWSMTDGVHTISFPTDILNVLELWRDGSGHISWVIIAYAIAHSVEMLSNFRQDAVLAGLMLVWRQRRRA